MSRSEWFENVRQQFHDEADAWADRWEAATGQDGHLYRIAMHRSADENADFLAELVDKESAIES